MGDICIGGSRGHARHTPPTGPNSFIFAHIFGEKHLHQRSTPPPPMGNPGSATDISIQNMKFLCLTLWQGEVCTDDADANTNNEGQSMIV